MRLDRIDLVRWGSMADVTLDLTSGAPGLHVVYGVNEAGKSTARRAISSILYGIPMQTPDNFRYDYKELRIGAAARFPDGSTLAFLRRKTKKDAVVDANNCPVDDAPLVRALAGIDREAFEQEWSLDHEQLRAGGQSLLEGKGELGQSLLAAGLGGIEVAAIQAQLEVEANARSPKKLGATLLDELKQREAAKKALTITADWVEEKRARLERVREERAGIEKPREAAERELRTLDRIEKARPSIVERDRLSAEVEKLRATPRVGAEFGKRRVAAQKGLDAATLDLEKATKDLAACEERLSKIALDETVPPLGDEIEELLVGLEAHGERLTQIATHEAEAQRCERDVAALARSLGLDPAALSALAKGPHALIAARARELSEERTKVRAEILATRTALETEREALAKHEAAALEAKPPATDDAALRSALERVEKELAGAEKNLEKLARKRDAAAEAAGEAFEKLATRWTGGRAALEKAVLPETHEIEAHEERLEAEKRVTEAAEAVAAVEEEVGKRGRAIQRLQASGAVPSETALREQRERRQAGWELVRPFLDGKRPPDGAVATYAGERTLAGAYEAAVHGADEVADRLRLDSTRAAKLESEQAAKEEATARLGPARRALREAEEAAAAARAAWTSLWKPHGIEPDAPKAMRKWVDAADEARRLFKEEARARRELDALEAQVRAEIAPLAALLGRKGTDVGLLASIRDEATARVEKADEARRAHETAAKELASARERVRKLEQKLSKSEARDAEGATAWADVAARLGLRSDVSPRELVVLADGVVKAESLLSQIAAASSALARLREQRDAYAARVRRIAAALREPLDEARLAVTVRALGDRLSEVRTAQQRRETEGTLAEKARGRRADADDRARHAEAEIRRLCEEAGTGDPRELARIEAENDARRGLEARIDRADAELAMVADQGVDALRASVAATSVLDVPIRRTKAEAEREGARVSLGQKSEEVGALESELGKVAGGAEAADVEELIQSLRVKLRDACADFLRLSYAAMLLRQAAERYREENQSPILRRTSALFARMTLGSFHGVEVDDEESVIKGVRGERELVAVDGMSDGARDLLFLALRLAALEQHLTRREPLPFVIDDILINLSDDRAAAALEVLAEFGGKTQVLLFTHHARIAEMAERMRSGAVRVHRIGARVAEEARESLSASALRAD